MYYNDDEKIARSPLLMAFLLGASHDTLIPVLDASSDAAMVLAACHSLVSVASNKPAAPGSAATAAAGEEGEGVDARPLPVKKELVGDPIELAAIKGEEDN